MELNTPAMITSAIATMALVSPILVALINNAHNRKVRKLELDHDMSIKRLTIHYEDKKNAFSKFLTFAGKVCTDEALHESELDFYAYSQLAILFASDTNQKLISDFTNDVIQYLVTEMPLEKSIEFEKRLATIASSLNQELSSIQSAICKYKDRV